MFLTSTCGYPFRRSRVRARPHKNRAEPARTMSRAALPRMCRRPSLLSTIDKYNKNSRKSNCFCACISLFFVEGARATSDWDRSTSPQAPPRAGSLSSRRRTCGDTRPRRVAPDESFGKAVEVEDIHIRPLDLTPSLYTTNGVQPMPLSRALCRAILLDTGARARKDGRRTI